MFHLWLGDMNNIQKDSMKGKKILIIIIILNVISFVMGIIVLIKTYWGRRAKIFIIILILPLLAFSDKGEIVKRVSSCDWFLIETISGLVLLEWFEGNDPDIEDIV